MMRTGQIGFSQRIRLEWLEYTANLVLAGNTRSEVIVSLQGYLQDKLSVGGQAERGNREKSITILVKTWADVSDELVPLRDQGLNLLQRLPVGDHVFIHWCMSMAAYPFWGAVAETTGRLLRLQESAGAAQVQRRMRELLGERETVARSTRRVLRAFVDWGVLWEAREKGLYSQAPLFTIEDTDLITWSIWSFLVSTGKKLETPKAIVGSPRFFPFTIGMPSAHDLEACQHIEVHRHGLNHDMAVSLWEAQRAVSTQATRLAGH